MKTLDFNNSKGLALLSQEMIYTSSLKKLEKPEKCYFHTLRTFAPYQKISSKEFSTMLIFDLCSFESFKLLFQKIISTLSLTKS